MQPRGLSRDEVALAALRILDDFGLPDLTMRRLADALGVQPSALYWHFPNKQALLADLADRIVSDADGVSVPGDRDARAATSALRAALLAHRDSAEIVLSTLALGIGEDRITARLVAALEGSGLQPETALRAAATLRHFVLGHVALEQQRRQYTRLGARVDDTMTSALDTFDEDFRFGVDTILAGLATREQDQVTATSRAEDERPR